MAIWCHTDDVYNTLGLTLLANALQVPQQFSINVLGADDPPSTSAGSAAAAPAELAAHLEPAQDTPAPAAEPSIADVPLPDFLEATQEAKENSEAPAAKPSAADSDACAPAAEPSAETAAAIADMHKRAADEVCTLKAAMPIL